MFKQLAAKMKVLKGILIQGLNKVEAKQMTES